MHRNQNRVKENEEIEECVPRKNKIKPQKKTVMKQKQVIYMVAKSNHKNACQAQRKIG